MVNPRRGLEGEALERKHSWDVARAMLIGSVLWVGMYRFDGPENSRMKQFLKQAVRLREELQPFIQQGVYKDSEDVLFISEGVDIARWKLDGGEELYIIANLQQRDNAYFDIEVKDPSMLSVSGGDMDVSGQAAAFSLLDGGTLRVIVPPAAISYRLVIAG
jgi:hypothetical protein